MTIPDTHVPDFGEDRKRRLRQMAACKRHVAKSQIGLLRKGEVWTSVNNVGSIAPPSCAVFPKANREIHLHRIKQRGRQKPQQSASSVCRTQGKGGNCEKVLCSPVMKVLLPAVRIISSRCCLAHNVLFKI